MSQLTLESLEQRIVALERGMAQWLQAQQQAVRFKDWRQGGGAVHAERPVPGNRRRRTKDPWGWPPAGWTMILLDTDHLTILK